MSCNLWFRKTSAIRTSWNSWWWSRKSFKIRIIMFHVGLLQQLPLQVQQQAEKELLAFLQQALAWLTWLYSSRCRKRTMKTSMKASPKIMRSCLQTFYRHLMISLKSHQTSFLVKVKESFHSCKVKRGHLKEVNMSWALQLQLICNWIQTERTRSLKMQCYSTLIHKLTC